MRISHPKNTAPCSEDLLAMLSVCGGDVFSNVRQPVLIEATSPIGLARQERSVSALRHIKSHMRASIGQNTPKSAHGTCVQGAALAPCVCPCGLQDPGPRLQSPVPPYSALPRSVFAAVVLAWPLSPLLAQQSAVCAQDKTQDIRR